MADEDSALKWSHCARFSRGIRMLQMAAKINKVSVLKEPYLKIESDHCRPLYKEFSQWPQPYIHHPKGGKHGMEIDTNCFDDDSVKDPDYVPESDTESDKESFIFPFNKVRSRVEQTHPANAEEKDAKTSHVQNIRETEIEEIEISHAEKKDNSDFTRSDKMSFEIDIRETDEKRVDRKHKKKPKRPCPFCGKQQSKLSRHMKLKHADMQQVADALRQPKPERDRIFLSLKKEGIYKYNIELLKNDALEADLMMEKKRGASRILMCGHCKGFYSKDYYYKHKEKCFSDVTTTKASVPVSLLNCVESEEFKREILARFIFDEVGNLCREDNTIKTIGRRLYEKMMRKKDKKVEVRRSTMTDMRRIGTLFLAFRKSKGDNCNSCEIFHRANFEHLENAIDAVTAADVQSTEVKAGLRQNLGYLLKRGAKILKGTYLINDDDDKATEIDKFLDVLNLQWNALFGDAEYLCNKKRQVILRKPAELPLEKDVEKLHNYALKRIDELVNDPYLIWGSAEYVELRDLLVARLTMYNGRRGGEPSRLLLHEVEEAMNNAWINESTVASILDKLEKQLIQQIKVAYQSGKGSHLVPVLIPKDCINGIEIMAHSDKRQAAGVSAKNVFAFPCVKQSEDHPSGWHCIREICKAAGTSKNITATKNRHRVSTIYAAFENTEKEKEAFYKHMGHSAEMNTSVYQCPPAVLEVTKVGKFLNSLDERVGKGQDQDEIEPCCKKRLTATSVIGVRESEIQQKKPADADLVQKMPCTKRAKTSSGLNMRETAHQYVRWTTKGTSILNNKFKLFIQEDGTGNCGLLPGRKDVAEFIEIEKLQELENLPVKEKIQKIQTKIFNERKKFRETMAQKMKKLQS